MGMENIIPNAGENAGQPTTSLEKAHAMAVANLDRAEQLLAKATEDGANDARLDELRRLRDVAREDLERTRKQL